jgi:hypothetical protein
MGHRAGVLPDGALVSLFHLPPGDHSMFASKYHFHALVFVMFAAAFSSAAVKGWNDVTVFSYAFGYTFADVAIAWVLGFVAYGVVRLVQKLRRWVKI